jgi:hypothetical protein
VIGPSISTEGMIVAEVLMSSQYVIDVSLNTFLVNSTIVVVLFDSRASHSFIAFAYVEKHSILVALLNYHMVVSSPRGDMPTRQVRLKVKIFLRG